MWMFDIRHEPYNFMTLWSCFRRLVSQSQVRVNFNRYLRLKLFLHRNLPDQLDADLTSQTRTTIFEVLAKCRRVQNWILGICETSVFLYQNETRQDSLV